VAWRGPVEPVYWIATNASYDGVVFVDVGIGDGLALHVDRCRYLFRGPGERRATVGHPDSDVPPREFP
jgi:hypothetical protein